jgi:hypothetical protein
MSMRALAWVVLSCLLSAPSALAEEQSELRPGLQLLDPIRFRQLTVIPVVEKVSAPDHEDYLTLAAGLERKEVDVREAEGGGAVNHVTVRNRSSRPLLLLGGEVILGGQQDRIIGKDTLVSPKQTVAVEVYCVEHGRWNGSSAFTASGGLAENKLRVRAKYRSDQGAVWAEVAEKNAKLGAESESGTYRKLAVGEEGKKAIAPYRTHLLGALKALPQSERLVGVVAAVNGRIVSADIFATPKLFAAYRDRLLDSLFISVADVPESPAAAAPTPPADVRAFLDKAEAAKPETIQDNDSGTTVERKAPGVLNSTVQAKSPKGAPVKPIYQSYQANQ